MKRIFALLLAFSLLLLCGCSNLDRMINPKPKGGLGADTSVYPVYDNLTQTEKEIWENVRAVMEQHSSEKVFVGSYATQYEMDNAKDRLNHFMRELAYTYPDYFWVNAYSFQIYSTTGNGIFELSVEPKYIMDAAEAAQKNTAYTEAVHDIVNAAKAFDDQFDQVLYVYDAIMARATYDHALADSEDTADIGRTAYGCLVNGDTICSGYALAFRSIMEKLGIECGVEFNSYSKFNLSSDGHVWNYCKLGGEYYYFDLTWDDTGFDSEDYKDVLPYSHLYFGITAKELSASTYDIDANAPTPECNGTEFNYFVHKGLSFPEYSYDAVAPAIQANKNDGYVFLRFDSYYALEQAVKDLITDQKIFDVLPNLNSLSYLSCKTDHHLMLIF